MSLVRSDSSGVRRALKRLGEMVEEESTRSLEVAARVAEASAKATKTWKDGEESNPDGSPRRHGVHTRDTIEGGATGLRGFVECGGAGRFLENGTRPHRILPRRKKFLRFWSNGVGPIFSRGANHPGTKPTRFLHDAATEAMTYLAWKLKADASRSIRAVGLGT